MYQERRVALGLTGLWTPDIKKLKKKKEMEGGMFGASMNRCED